MAATVSANRRALADLARARHERQGKDRRLRVAAVGLATLCLLAVMILWLAGFFSVPREVRAVTALVDERITELGRVARNEVPLSYESSSFSAMFEAARQVPEAYREQARQEIGRLFEARETAEIDSFFGLSPERRSAELDRRIKAEEERRRAWEAARSRRAAERGQEDGGRRGGTGQPSGPAAVAGTGGRRRGGGTEETRNVRAKASIDRSTAETRARRTEYRRLKEQRRIELGLGGGR